MKQPLGVILAGGRARRMGGGDKALAELGGRSLLAHVVERLAPQVRGLALSANGDPDRFRSFGLPVLPDTMPGNLGPLAGVLAGMDWAAKAGADHIVTAAADTPFLSRNLVDQLALAASEAHEPIALAATDNGLHPTFGIWPVSLRDDLRLALETGTRKVVAWAAGQGMARCEFSSLPHDPFFNINTPEDLEQARSLIAGE
ncbi:MAG: molybdenum cofactor guanylyltransferase MobA [Maritimibacter sp.]